MRRTTALPELLSPAGSWEALLAAVEAGADAVYLGGKLYGARAFAKNFDEDGIREAVRYCHLHGVKVYVTVNTLLFDRELSDALTYLSFLYEAGVDAVISADLGLCSLIRTHLPGLPLHASTQASLHNTEGVRMAQSLGFERAVIAREVTLKDMRRIVEQSPIEIEVFLHGALCVCHSGQCLFSSLVGGRSGNRGECAQPCRLPYNGKDKYPLSLKDLSLAAHVPALIESGVSSLKIEGRMKSPDYVYGVTSIYRRLLDEHRAATPEEHKRLAELFSRGGFTDGYATGKHDRPMTGVRSEEDKSASRQLDAHTFTPMRHAACASAVFRLGEPAKMTLFDKNRSVTVIGDIPSVAQNAPLNIADLSTRLCKMGNTYLSLAPNDLKIDLDEGINLPPSAINALRRAAVDAFSDTSRLTPTPVTIDREKAQKTRPLRTAQFFRPELFCALSNSDRDRLDIAFVPLFSEPFPDGASGVSIPPVITESEWDAVYNALEKCASRGVRYALVSNLSHLPLVREFSLTPIGDFRLNVTNGYTKRVLHNLGITDFVLSPELTLPQTRDIGGGVIVWGRIPLMLTERCFVRENGGCHTCGSFTLTDRMGKQFPILREYPHRNLIFNSLPTYLGDRKDELSRAGLHHAHFLFSTETPYEAHAVLCAYDKGERVPFEVRRMKK